MSQLSLPIEEFYLALPDGDRQYAQEQAQEIKLIAHNASIQIGLKLIKVKERLGHGNFGEWIKLEFEWSKSQAHRLMVIAESFSNFPDSGDLPKAQSSAYALASAMSKEDEEGKQEILDSYQETLAEKQNQAQSNGKKIPNTLTEKEIKELIDRRDQLEKQVGEKDSTINQLTQANRFVSSQLEEKKGLITQIESNLQQMALSSANAIAESKVKEATEKLRNELTELKGEKKRLESAKTEAESSLKDAKEAHAKALADFKANPDPATKTKKEQLEREANKAQSELDTTQAELKRLHLQLEDLKTKANHAVSVSITLCAFHKAFKKFMADNTEAIIAMSSPYLDGRQQAEIESLAATLNDWAQKIQDSIDNLRGQTSRAVDVEVIQPIRYFPGSEEYEEGDF